MQRGCKHVGSHYSQQLRPSLHRSGPASGSRDDVPASAVGASDLSKACHAEYRIFTTSKRLITETDPPRRKSRAKVLEKLRARFHKLNKASQDNLCQARIGGVI